MTMTTSTSVCPGCHRDGDAPHACTGTGSLTDASGSTRDAPCKCEVDRECANWRSVGANSLPDLSGEPAATAPGWGAMSGGWMWHG